jgi:membrane protein DedA with SNARE-associated domain
MTDLIIYSVSSPEISGYIRHFGYVGIFLFFITVYQLMLIPEEITLLSIGYLCANNLFDPILTGVFSLSAFLTVDIGYFALAKSGNKFLLKIYNRVNHSATDKYKEKLKTNLAKTLIVLCFIPRICLFGPLLVGMMNLSFNKFIVFDLIGLSIFTAVYISLGIVFHNSLHSRISELEVVQHIIFFSIILIIGILVVLFIKKTRKK